MSKYSVTVITIGGGCSTIRVNTFKEAVEKAYLNCTENWCKYCSISRKNSTAMYVAGDKGRIWVSKQSMSVLWWQGKVPCGAKEITGKFKKPENYSL